MRGYFVVAPFPIQKEGIIGLDILRALGARIDLATEEIAIGAQKIKLENHPPIGRREYGQHARASQTEPRAQNSTDDEVRMALGTATEPRRPVIVVEKGNQPS
jgi:hypothetical protein